MYLFKFGVTGIQDFIGAARKVRDSACASAILTQLMRAVLDKAKDAGAERLLPHDPSACSHQITLRINGDQETTRALGLELTGAFAAKWRNLAEQAGCPDSSEWSAQIDAAFSPLWVAVLCRQHNAEAALERLQLLYEERKLTRLVTPNVPGKQAGGCSLCGLRDALAAPYKDREDERVCAVCFVKRRIAPDPIGAPSPIASTRDLAAAPFPETEQDLRDLDDARVYLEIGLSREVSDDEVLAYLLEPDDLPDNMEAQSRAEFDEVSLRVRARVGVYYAILVFDGDRMGRWFSGTAQHRLDADDGLSHLTRIGAAATAFKISMDALALSPPSVRAYLGGDDGLLFLPVDEALTTAGAIHQRFGSAMAHLRNGGPTVSVSVVFAHASSVPLQDALAKARHELESLAKMQLERNALAVSALFGTGSSVSGGARWNALDPGLPAWMDACVGATKQGLSRQFWYELMEQLPACFLLPDEDRNRTLHPAGNAMLACIARRLWERHDGADALFAEFLTGLLALANVHGMALNPLDNLRSVLKIVDFLARREKA